MKNHLLPWHHASLLIVIVVLVSACGGTPPSTPPAQHLDNPFALNTQEVTLVDRSGLAAAAVVTGSLETTFSDGRPPLLTPQRFQVALSFAANVGFGTPLDEPPCGVEIIALEISIVVSDSDGTRSVALPPLELNKRLVLEPNGVNYRIITQGAQAAVDIRDRELIDELNTILTSGGTNTATVTISALTQSVPALPTGSSLTFTLQSASGVFGF